MTLNIMNLTSNDLAKMIDQTLLKPYADYVAFKNFCEESARYSFKMVAVNCAATEICKELLKNSDVLVGAAVGFPLGQNTLETKLFETADAIQKGADEIDYVVNLCQLKSGNTDYIKREMSGIVEICKKNNVTSKVILENCYLTETEKETLCKIALDIKPDYIKTSTGFGNGGAKVEDVRFMKSIVGDFIKVKAAGGIRDLDTAIAMIEAGAERIGTSAGPKIVDAYKAKYCK